MAGGVRPLVPVAIDDDQSDFRRKMMPKDSLLDFDTALSGYVCSQLRDHLTELSERPTPTRRLHPRVWDNLAVSEWMGWAVGTLPTALADHIWDGVAGDVRHRPLSVDELGEIVLAVDDPPRRSESSAVWSASVRIHRQYIECLPEIRSNLAGPTADEWAATSIQFGTTLSRPGLPLGEGVDAVWAWIRELRRLRRTIREGRTGSTQEGATSPHRQSAPHDGGDGDGKSKGPVCDWKEAMQLTGLKKSKLYQLFHQGRLTGYKDGIIRFYRTGLMGFMKERENVAAPPTTPTPQRKPPARSSAAGTRFRFL
jgi:hypothetical protein